MVIVAEGHTIIEYDVVHKAVSGLLNERLDVVLGNDEYLQSVVDESEEVLSLVSQQVAIRGGIGADVCENDETLLARLGESSN